MTTGERRILILGVFLTDVPSLIREIVSECARSRDWQVTQDWVALGRAASPSHFEGVSVTRVRRPASKFALLNARLEALGRQSFRHIVVMDDDVELPERFVDRYLGVVETCQFALAQPSRTHDSSIDHVIVEQLDGLDARQTRFVEIGPCFSMSREAAQCITPFDEKAPMGWGLDFVWPLALEENGLTQGIVDATPVRHSFRRTVSLYDHRKTDSAMREYLRQRPHLTREEAFVILKSMTLNE